ncbi:MAG TPA: hypothetical protein VNQ32_12185 [Steroidobacteraceae bacterium]|nr:hypothetical protein [Steroidobacteraceae bacterium]
MKTKIGRPGVWAMTLCAVALTGCDTVKDVRSEPATALPKEKVVLKGIINNLGGGRGITLRYSPTAEVVSFLGADPAAPTDAPESVPISFGSLDEGTAYNVEIIAQPFGKTCTPVSGASGTLATGQETSIVIDCTPNIPRRDVVVTIPAAPAVFSGLPGAKVTLYTGEWMQERTVTPGQTSVTFEDSVFSVTVPVTNTDGTVTNVAAGTPLAYAVSASFVDPEGNVSRCLVTNATGSNPLADVTNVTVGLSASTTEPACQFTMSGSVAYSTPPGGSPETGAIPGGLLLEVRDTQGNVKTSYEVSDYGAFTVGGTATPTLFSSNINAVYDIAVARQPTGRSCVVGDGGAVSFYRTGTINPTNVTATAAPGFAAGTRAWGTRLNVFCRALPTAGNELAGTYRLTSSTWKAAAVSGVNPPPITVKYDNYDWTTQNLGSSNMLTFFDDGTFLYGTHAYIAGSLPDPFLPASPYATQVEHGFYNYDPVGGTLQFTLITDTNPTAAMPSTYAATVNIVWNAARTGTPGLSAAPAPIVSAAATAGAGIGIWTAVMNNVQKSTMPFGYGRFPDQTLSRITGTFGGANANAARLDWELTEPQSIQGEMTGTWAARDNRRFWVWDYLTYYGTHVGVVGGAPSMNDACFTVAEVEAPFGIYTRRGSSTGCYPYNRPSRGTAYLFGFSEAADFHLTDITLSTNTFVGVAPLAVGIPTAPSTNIAGNVSGSRLVPQFGTTALAVLPGFVGRIPGGQSAADGRSPSPIVYKIAPASAFAAEVASTFYDDIGEPASRYFDDLDEVGPFTDWCQTEILAIRATLHAEPINYPVYFCRTRAE